MVGARENSILVTLPAIQLIAVIVVSCITASCGLSKSPGCSFTDAPPPPISESSLTSDNIEHLLAGSEDTGSGLIAWGWVKELIRHGNEPEVKSGLIKAAAPNQRFRIQATFGLFYMDDDPRTRFASILDMLINGSEKEKSNIINLLPMVLNRDSDSQYIPEIQKLLANTDPQIRALAVAVITNFPDLPGVMDSIFAAGNDQSPEVRDETAYALYEMAWKNPARIENADGYRVLSQLVAANDWPGGSDVALGAAALCIGDPVMASTLQNKLKNDPDSRGRWGVVEALRHAPRKDLAFPLLKLALSDPEAEVRRQAVTVLNTIPRNDLALPLLKLALSDSDAEVRRQAEDALGYTKLRRYIKAGVWAVVLILLVAASVLSYQKWAKRNPNSAK